MCTPVAYPAGYHCEPLSGLRTASGCTPAEASAASRWAEESVRTVSGLSPGLQWADSEVYQPLSALSGQPEQAEGASSERRAARPESPDSCGVLPQCPLSQSSEPVSPTTVTERKQSFRNFQQRWFSFNLGQPRREISFAEKFSAGTKTRFSVGVRSS